MRFSRPLLLALVLLGLMVPAASAADAPDILFSANPKNVQIVKSGKTLRLVMPANARTTWFTDRPERKAGSTNLRRLAATWTAMGFRADPPNAALILTHKGQSRTHVITLTNPRIRNGHVSYRIRAVPNTDEAGHRHTDPLRRGRYGRAELFIDDATYPPCPAQEWSVVNCILAPNASLIVYTFGTPPALSACAEVAPQPVVFLGWGSDSGESGFWSLDLCGDQGPQLLTQALPDNTRVALMNLSPAGLLIRLS